MHLVILFKNCVFMIQSTLQVRRGLLNSMFIRTSIASLFIVSVGQILVYKI